MTRAEQVAWDAQEDSMKLSGSSEVKERREVAGGACLDDVSPKQAGSRARRDWYPYYAGFTERFVEAVIDQYFGEAESVLDPWSGSGTTTVTCLRRGLRSRGIDVNPAVTVVARARLNPVTAKARLLELGKRIVEGAVPDRDAMPVGDLLDEWMTAEAAERIRRLREAIHEVLDEPEKRAPAGGDLGVERLSAKACFFYCGLFGAVRKLLGRYGTTNPMWLKPAQSRRNRIRPSEKTLRASFIAQTEYLAERLSLRPEQEPGECSGFEIGHAGRIGVADNTFDAVLTSPTYATRLDYVKGMLPELAVLGANGWNVRELRRVSTGSPTVDGDRASVEDVRSKRGRELLSAIESHESKGSRSYYFPWMTNYLTSLQCGLEEIDRVVADGGVICVVVQDSYYKEVHVDLQEMVEEMFADMGRAMLRRHDYSAPNPRRGSDPVEYGEEGKTSCRESLLVFKGEVRG